MRQIDPDVVCAYPITPQTEVVQLYAQMVADGKVSSEFVTVESEHSAMSAVIGSAAAGARTMTATSSQGFALMWELLYVASSYRLPVVMTMVNRALSGPINIHCDHSDSMGGRDTGWIQIYGEDHQQAYDNCIQAIRIAEHMDVRLPVMHMYDGYVISGAIGPLVMLPDEKVRDFIGPFHAINPLLDTKRPVTVGPFDGLHGWYFEHKVSQNRAMDRAFK
ncbi:MAG: pyruvate ferredoxin oxidoreductase, partial [Actinobacteria bacterium]|nr:pyruvate ferredoxin oxidoreductase [Actinomycetota bacterium]